ncbi:MAG: HesA/MoeB/ThiF family protein [Pseudomonadota bacterium]|nr:HesA/MoeB/ThiF family protein [Pseudomonadota bacterium]
MDDEQLLRYSRHILLPQIGIAGQQRLLQAQVLVVGLGGLGSAVAMYLAAAGVGHLKICDFDVVDLSNLQRQIIHNMDDIGKTKVQSAKETLSALNPTIEITALHSGEQLEQRVEQLSPLDVIVDCSDNLPTRLAINRACVSHNIPLVSGAVIRMEGQLIVFRNDIAKSPCYQCLYTEAQAAEETCSQNGILAPLAGIIGSLQALETLKIIMNVGTTWHRQLLMFDGLNMEWQTLQLTPQPHCPICG